MNIALCEYRARRFAERYRRFFVKYHFLGRAAAFAAFVFIFFSTEIIVSTFMIFLLFTLSGPAIYYSLRKPTIALQCLYAMLFTGCVSATGFIFFVIALVKSLTGADDGRAIQIMGYMVVGLLFSAVVITATFAIASLFIKDDKLRYCDIVESIK